MRKDLKEEPKREQTTIRLPLQLKDELQREVEEPQEKTITRLRKPWFDRLLDKHPYFPTAISCVALLISLILFLAILLTKLGL